MDFLYFFLHPTIFLSFISFFILKGSMKENWLKMKMSDYFSVMVEHITPSNLRLNLML